MQTCAGVKDGIAADDFQRFEFERGRESAFRDAIMILEGLDPFASSGASADAPKVAPTDLILDVQAEFQVIRPGGQDWTNKDVNKLCDEMARKIAHAIEPRDRVSITALPSLESGDEAFSNQ
jgi:hypothetical protein